jgi:hypothetical protein
LPSSKAGSPAAVGGGWSVLALFALYPAVINTVTSDLRARILFHRRARILAVYFRRPFIEKLLFFGLLIAIREEGILLGLIVILFNFLRMKGQPGKWKETLIYICLAAAAFAAFMAFMAWGGYNRVEAAVQ